MIKLAVNIEFFILLIVLVKSCGKVPKIFTFVMRQKLSFCFKVVDKSTTLKLILRFLTDFGKTSIENVKNDRIVSSHTICIWMSIW